MPSRNKQHTAPNLLDYLPLTGTPGFLQVSGNAMKVWIALACHARAMGTGAGGVWSIDELVNAVGISKTTASRLLRELAALGWISKGRERHATGVYGGFVYEITKPPADRITETAEDMYHQRLESKRERMQAEEKALLDAAGGELRPLPPKDWWKAPPDIEHDDDDDGNEDCLPMNRKPR